MTQTFSTSSKARWVNELVNARFTLIPLMPGTKAPYTFDWVKTPYNPLLTVDDLPDNYGVILRDDTVVIDVDPRNFKNGVDSFGVLMADLGITQKVDTYIVGTGGGGLHIYFKKPEGLTLKAKHKKYPGIDIKSKGAQLVGPGSIHPDTHKPYIVKTGVPDTLAPAPNTLFDIFAKEKKEAKADQAYDDSPGNQERYANWLRTNRVAVQGDGGDLLTLNTAQWGRDMGLSEPVVLELMSQHWNPRCQPPWSESELAVKVANAYAYAKEAIGHKNAAADFEPVELDPADRRILAMRKAWADAGLRWDIKRTGNLPIAWRNTMSNALNLFRHDHCPPDYHNPFKDLIRLNAFTHNIEFMRRAPWHLTDGVKHWTDIDTIHMIAYINDHVTQSEVRDRWCIPKETAFDAVAKHAYDNQYHPVRDYLESLEWDRESRVETLFPYYTGAEDSPYTRAVSRCFLIACVARIMKPGCQHDHVVILEGKQGTGKSSFCRVLGNGYYANLHLDPRNKDTVMNMFGAWIIELSEFICARRSEANELKAFISSPCDTFRKPYGRVSESIPRQSVFIATINPEDDLGYLQDQTGNRRFWPIETHYIHLQELARDRDQLFAEALHLYKKGEPWYLKDEKLVAQAVEQQARRTAGDVWAGNIATWLAREAVQRRPHPVLSREYIATEILNIPYREQNRGVHNRISMAMRELGWQPTRIREKNGVQIRAYRPPMHFGLEDL